MGKIKNYLQDFNCVKDFMSLKTNISGDITGGLTAAVVAFPLVLAFGVSSGLGVKAGLIGAIFVGLLAALFGGCPALISGPTAPMTILTATIVAQHLHQPGFIFATIVLAGILQIILGLTKIAKYIQYMPYPVVSGFMSGIGIIILVTQINPLFGIEAASTVGETLRSLPQLLLHLNNGAAIIACITLILIYALPKIHQHFPATLVGIILGTIIVQLFHLQVPTIGDISSALPSFQRFSFSWGSFQQMLGPAMTLAVMGLLDTLLTCLIVDHMTKKKHNSNKTLVGQGLGNSLSGLLGGLPGAGATLRTQVNISNGGKTPLAGVTYSAVTLISMLFLGVWLKGIPIACLAAVLVKAGLDLIDFKTLKQILKAPLFDEIILAVVLLLTVTINIMVAVGIGLLLACVLFVKRMGDLLSLNIVTLNDLEMPWVSDESWREELTREEKNKILVFQMNGPLFFGASSNFLKSSEKHGDFNGLILRMHRVPEIDITGAYALEELAELFKKEKKFLFIAGLSEGPKAFLRKLRIFDLIGGENFFRRFDDAACRAAKLIKANRKIIS